MVGALGTAFSFLSFLWPAVLRFTRNIPVCSVQLEAERSEVLLRISIGISICPGSPTFIMSFRGCFQNHHYFSRGLYLSSSKRKVTSFFKWWKGLPRDWISIGISISSVSCSIFKTLPQLGIAFFPKNATCHQTFLEGKMLISCGERWWWTWYANAPNFFLWNFRVFFCICVFVFEHQRLQGICCICCWLLLSSNSFIQFQVYSKTFRKKTQQDVFQYLDDHMKMDRNLVWPSDFIAANHYGTTCTTLLHLWNQAMVALRVHGSAMQYLQKPMSEEMGLVFYPKITFFFFKRSFFVILCESKNQVEMILKYVFRYQPLN